MMATTRLIFFPNKLKKSKKTGRIPIYLRLLHLGVKAEARLNVDVDEKDLALWNERTMSFEHRDNKINNRLYSIKTAFEKLEIKNNYLLSGLTAKSIICELTGPPATEFKTQVLALDYVEGYFNKYVINNKSYVYNTVKTYRKAVNHFKNYIAKNRLNGLLLNQYTHEHAQAFKCYLTSDYDAILKKAMTEVSASSVICKMKVIFSNAMDSDLISKNPFTKIKITTVSPPKPKLTLAELKRVAEIDLSELEGLEIYRDIFLFSCYTGLSYNDFSALKRSTLCKTDFGLKIASSRGKTSMVIEQLLIDQAQNILKKYENHPQVKICDTLLPPRSMTQINIHLKIIATIGKVSKKLSTSIGRCTCRQLLSEAGVQDPLVIHSIMGWSTAKSIDFKYYSITDTLLNEAKFKFQNYLKGKAI